MKSLFLCFIISILMIIGCTNNKKNNFELCSGSLYPYYYPQLNYEGGFYEIKEHFFNNYSIINSDNNTGIIKIRFHVNCNGEAGNYKLESYSLNYVVINLDKEITQQIITLTKGLKKWIPAKDDDGNTINSHKFFAFKIIDGELIDILPK